MPADLPESQSIGHLLREQTRALQLVNSGGPLTEALDILARAAETQSASSFLASILLLEEDGVHLRHGAAPSLPAEYNAAIDGIAIGPRVGSCGTAAFLGHAIFVTDIERDPLWADFRDLALRHGLRACWSTPLLAKDGSVLGTVALYYRQPRNPSASERDIVSLICATCALIVEKAKVDATLKLLLQREELAASMGQLGLFTWDMDSDKVTWQNERPYEIFGIPRSDGPINAQRFSSEFLHPGDQEAFAQAVRDAAQTGGRFQCRARIRRKPAGELRTIEIDGAFDSEAFAKGKRRVVGVVSDVTRHAV